MKPMHLSHGVSERGRGSSQAPRQARHLKHLQFQAGHRRVLALGVRARRLVVRLGSEQLAGEGR